MVKMIYSLFTFPHFGSAWRPEREGHNTCKSILGTGIMCCETIICCDNSRSHHTNSFAHSIIMKFKNKKVGLFLLKMWLFASGVNLQIIILLPICIDSVMIWCSKSIKMMKDRSNSKSLR